jgi:hypothetical protein
MQQGYNFFQIPDVIGNARLHRRSNTQALVNPTEVVVHEVQGRHVLQIFDLLAEGVQTPQMLREYAISSEF